MADREVVTQSTQRAQDSRLAVWSRKEKLARQSGVKPFAQIAQAKLPHSKN